MAKVIINTREYCKTTLKISIDISEATQYDMNKEGLMQLRPGVYRPRRQVVESVASPVLQRKPEGSHLEIGRAHV